MKYNQNNLADRQSALWLERMSESNQIMDESTLQLQLGEWTQMHSGKEYPVMSKIDWVLLLLVFVLYWE